MTSPIRTDRVRGSVLRRFTKSVGVLLAVAIASLPLTGTAVQVAPREVADPLDSRSEIDIRSVVVDRSADVASFRITTEDPFETEVAPCLAIQAGLRRIGWRICGDGDVIRTATGKGNETVTVERPTARSIVYTFGTGVVGASFYRWRAVVLASTCRDGVCDRSPNEGWFVIKRTVTYGTWAETFLAEVEAPICRNNRVVVVAWMVNEGTAAVWNPLATTYTMAGNTVYNSHGVKNYPDHEVGLDASRLTLERGWKIYGYAPIVRKLRNCKPAIKTAHAIRRSSWCAGCTNGRYVVGLIRPVRNRLGAYSAREIATAN